MPDRQINAPIEEEMRKSYLDYAMSVIVGRALPDVRDGLKPVHRRILYAMSCSASRTASTTSAPAWSARSWASSTPTATPPIYDAMVRMAQEFRSATRWWTGRATSARSTATRPPPCATPKRAWPRSPDEMLVDIDKDTVDFTANFDDDDDGADRAPGHASRTSSSTARPASRSAWRPTSRRTTSPRSSTAWSRLIDRPEDHDRAAHEDHHGPDFPTGGIYGTGRNPRRVHNRRGTITLRAKAHSEKLRAAARPIIITELPYQVNKATLIEKIAELSSARQEDRGHLRHPRRVRPRGHARRARAQARAAPRRSSSTSCYKHTQMQTTFGIIMLALVDRRPQVVTLKEMLEAFIKFRREVVTRRTRYDLARAEERAHILAGLRKAVEQLDLVIRIIREAANARRGARHPDRPGRRSPRSRPRPSSTCSCAGWPRSSGRRSSRSTSKS